MTCTSRTFPNGVTTCRNFGKVVPLRQSPAAVIRIVGEQRLHRTEPKTNKEFILNFPCSFINFYALADQTTATESTRAAMPRGQLITWIVKRTWSGRRAFRRGLPSWPRPKWWKGLLRARQGFIKSREILLEYFNENYSGRFTPWINRLRVLA